MDRNPWDQRHRGDEQLWRAEANPVKLHRTARPRAEHSANLAAGEDRNAVWSAARGWQLRAVDFATVVLANARRPADQRDG